MEDVNCTVSIATQARDKLKKIAKKDKRSMAKYLEVMIDEKYKKIFTQSSDNASMMLNK